VDTYRARGILKSLRRERGSRRETLLFGATGLLPEWRNEPFRKWRIPRDDRAISARARILRCVGF